MALWAAREFVPLLLAMFGVAVMRAGILPLVTALALTHLGAEDRGFGRIRLWGSVGFSVAVVVVGGKGGQPNPGLILPLHAVFALAAAAVATFLPQRARPVAPPGVRL